MSMKTFEAIYIPVTTDSGGAASETKATDVNGFIYAIDLKLGTLASGAADVTVSVTNTPDGVDRTLLTLTNVAANARYFPRELEDDNAGADATNRLMNLAVGRLKVVVAQGGNTKSGAVTVYVL